jgi:hypothetical protein
MHEAVWWFLNLGLGLPIAIGLVVLGRECVRALIALAFGFRVFEFRLGMGERLWSKPIGPVELGFSRFPVAASIVAESGSPKHHHLARWAQAGGPLLLQIVCLLCWSSTGVDGSKSIGATYAPLATLHLANMALIALHSLVPLETQSGFRSDIRCALDLAQNSAEMNRDARASFYARYARHWLERAQVNCAKKMLDRGLIQLGRDPLLVACQSRLQEEDLTSVIDQSACADTLRALVLAAEPRRSQMRKTWSVQERARQNFVSSLPFALAVLALSLVESERLSEHIHERMILQSQSVASERIESACESRIAQWNRWTPIFNRILSNRPEIDRDRHDQLAQLERCRGDADRAAFHQTRAIAEAEEVVARSGQLPGSDQPGRIESEIRLVALHRAFAELESERNRYRLALATLEEAASTLARAERRLRIESESGEWVEVEEQFAEERSQLNRTRQDILGQMGAR